MNKKYDRKLILRYFAIMVGFSVLCKLTDSFAYPILVFFAFSFALTRKVEPLFFIVLVTISSIVCNSWVIPKNLVFAVTQRGLLVGLGLVLLFMAAGQRKSLSVGPLRVFLLYIVYMAVISARGWSPIISYLKLFLFTAIFVAYYTTCNAASQIKGESRRIRSIILAVICFFIIGSILLIPFPSISNMTWDEVLQAATTDVSLFKGITVHSQTLGPVVAMCGVLVLGDLVFSIQRMDKFYLLLLVCVPILIIKTSSRTAMGGFLAGCFFVFWCVMQTRVLRSSWKSKVIQYAVLLAIGMGALIVALPSARESVMRFVVKYGNRDEKVEVSSENVLSTRQGKLDSALANWRQSPAIGNGFQVSEAMVGFQASSLASIITAPVEKSTWIYAILEEGGVAGMVIFCIGALVIMGTLVRRKAYIGASCFFTMLVLNLGEFSMFSMSGVGGFIWGMVFVGCTLDARRITEAKRLQQVVNFGWRG